MSAMIPDSDILPFSSNEIRSRGRNMYEMSDWERSNVNGPPTSTSTFIEKPIRRDDSLQNIAIKYGVKVVDLKKANNLVSDQDFFALNSIKIPMPKGSVREELVQQEEAAQSTSNLRNTRDMYIGNNQSDDSDYENDILSNTSESRRLLLPDQHVTTTVPLSIGDNFLKRIDENVHTASLSASRQEQRVQEVISQLATDSTPLAECSWDGIRSSRISGGGVSWPVMIAAAVFTAVVVPFVIGVYWYLTREDPENINTSATTTTHPSG